LGKILREELIRWILSHVDLDAHCYVYGSLPASEGCTGPAITFCAHLDTSPAESGARVTPVC
jgi:tripeptide aminopeptidase